MEEFYRLNNKAHDHHHLVSSSNDDHGNHTGTVVEIEHILTSTGYNTSSVFRGPPLNHDDDHDCDDDDDDDLDRFEAKASDSEKITDLIKTQIAKHPGYPDLVAAYIECQKVGAPPETASLLEEIRRENHTLGLSGCSSQVGADPELDNFMESYREILQRFKDELSKTFNEATMFLCNIQSQLSNLSEGEFTKILDYHTDEVAGTNCDQEEMMASDHERREIDEQDSYGVGAAGELVEIKDMLLRKYSGYATKLKSEFLKKRKKIELPKTARAALLRWWNDHYIWPYPTEEEKAKLSAETGLDQKQINNWFVNQRKRHWKPSENIKSALMKGASHGH